MYLNWWTQEYLTYKWLALGVQFFDELSDDVLPLRGSFRHRCRELHCCRSVPRPKVDVWRLESPGKKNIKKNKKKHLLPGKMAHWSGRSPQRAGYDRVQQWLTISSSSAPVMGKSVPSTPEVRCENEAGP